MNNTWDGFRRPGEGAPQGRQAPTSRPVAERPPVAATRPITDRSLGAGAPDTRPNLAEAVRRTLDTNAERRNQRKRVIWLLVAAQILLALAVAPGYFSPEPQWAPLAVIGGSILIYLSALATSRLLQRDTVAAYILVYGGLAASVAHTYLVALTPSPDRVAQTALVSLLVITSILQAGLFFDPNAALYTTGIAMLLSVVAIFLALSLSPRSSMRESYEAIVYAVILQGMAALIAWILAQFVYESAADALRAQEQRYAHAQLEATTQRWDHQQERLQASVREMQSAIGRVLTGSYSTRVSVYDGELSELMRSFNLLLNHFDGQLSGDLTRGDITSVIRQLMDIIHHMNDGTGFTPARIQPLSNSPLAGVVVALSHMQTQNAQRMAQAQRVTNEMAGAVDHGVAGLTGATAEMTKAKSLAGALRAAANNALPAIRANYLAVAQARSVIGALLPPGLTQGEEVSEAENDLLGDGSALITGNEALEGLDIIDDDEDEDFAPPEPIGADEAHVPPMTVKVPSLGESYDPTEPERVAIPPELEGATPQLFELWSLLGQVAKNLAQEFKTTKSLAREMGRLSRAVRSADTGVGFGQGALTAALQSADQLQQIVGTGFSGMEDSSGRFSSLQSFQPTASGGFAQPAPSAPSEVRETDEPATGSLNAADLLPQDVFKGGVPRADGQAGD